MEKFRCTGFQSVVISHVPRYGFIMLYSCGKSVVSISLESMNVLHGVTHMEKRNLLFVLIHASNYTSFGMAYVLSICKLILRVGEMFCSSKET